MEKNKCKFKNFQIEEINGVFMDICGYSKSSFKCILTYFGYLLSVGLLRLVLHWNPYIKLLCQNSRCNLNEARKILVKDIHGKYFIHKVHVQSVDSVNNINIWKHNLLKSDIKLRNQMLIFKESAFNITYFMHKRLKYIWNNCKQTFELLKSCEETTYLDITNRKPIKRDQLLYFRTLYGTNEILLKITPIFKMLITKCLSPFYCFQIFSCILWYVDEYWIYATCILVVSFISLGVEVYELRKNERVLKEMICSSSLVTVYRENDKNIEEYTELDSKDLLPGDIIEIPRHGCLMQCDAVILTGVCIMNESTLTGESVPVTKTALPESRLDSDLFKFQSESRHILFSGTRVIQTRNYSDERVLAKVIRTGFFTTKGELVRSILYPKPIKFKFVQDSFKFIGCLALIALIGFALSIYLLYVRNMGVFAMFIRGLDLITIVIPPALPVAMTVGVVYAQRRLKSQLIYCIDPDSINVCGVVNVACFDKTGTLTEDGLDLWGVLSVDNSKSFQKPIPKPEIIQSGPLIECLATCHSLTIIQGVLSGDPLDLKMFEATKWELIEDASEDYCKFEMTVPAVVRPPNQANILAINSTNPEEIPYELGIIKQFPFSSSLQRMSVIARVLSSNHFNVYTKGAPETISMLCNPDTVPSDFHSVLLHYTREGYRVLALAWKPLALSYVKVLRISREDIEQNFTFLGLLIMENRLKAETTPVIDQLKQANIRPMMVTGDNMLTALSVARDCNMIEEMDHIILVTAKKPSNLLSTTTHQSSSTLTNVSSTTSFPSNMNNPNYRLDQNADSKRSPPPVVFTKDELERIEQEMDLIQFHYAEDLHHPVTEIITTPLVDGGQTKYFHQTGKESKQMIRNMNYLKKMSISTQKQDLTTDNQVNCLLTVTMLDRSDFHLAISGKTWQIIRTYYPGLIPKLVVKGTVFARFSPDQKAQLIEELQSVGYFVSMCGDGANDCGALKTAHTGIALSNTEASIASPFTSKQYNISCVPKMIREGRCALVTSFGTFKFMVGYSMIQFVTVTVLYSTGTNISDYQFLYIDFYLITSLAFTFTYTKAYEKLDKLSPPVRLVSLINIISILNQIVLCGLIQVVVFILVKHQPWYVELFDYGEMYETMTLEGTAVFIVSIYQYLIMSIVFSRGKPYRGSIFTNYLFMLNILVILITNLIFSFYPTEFLRYWFELCKLPSFKFVLLLNAVVFGNFLLSYLLENFVQSVFFQNLVTRLHVAIFPRRIDRPNYERINDEIVSMNGSWPPLIRSTSIHCLPKDLFHDISHELPKLAKKRFNMDGESKLDVAKVQIDDQGDGFHYGSNDGKARHHHDSKLV